MAILTSPRVPEQHVHAHHDRLRAAAPVLAAMGVLLVVLLGGTLLLGNLFQDGLTFMSNR